MRLKVDRNLSGLRRSSLCTSEGIQLKVRGPPLVRSCKDKSLRPTPKQRTNNFDHTVSDLMERGERRPLAAFAAAEDYSLGGSVKSPDF
ncbi:hypothetical protein C5167_024995 [Papaver somniferum]|uniref:Uncharacterized protein n=1 Tax=Papaver somniferum TaxID=3469 RepID=A0A4Y7JT42_PAPSO|nr:hypothetical protein C5167_024995 [Papaver somniferum]